jgi:hypothetical protein
MKVTWEADDIIPGRRVGKAEREEQWLIGYHVHPKVYTLVSLC